MFPNNMKRRADTVGEGLEKRGVGEDEGRGSKPNVLPFPPTLNHRPRASNTLKHSTTPPCTPQRCPAHHLELHYLNIWHRTTSANRGRTSCFSEENSHTREHWKFVQHILTCYIRFCTFKVHVNGVKKKRTVQRQPLGDYSTKRWGFLARACGCRHNMYLL